MTTPNKPSTTNQPRTVNDRALAPATTGTPMPKVKPSTPAPTVIGQNGNKKN